MAAKICKVLLVFGAAHESLSKLINNALENALSIFQTVESVVPLKNAFCLFVVTTIQSICLQRNNENIDSFK